MRVYIVTDECSDIMFRSSTAMYTPIQLDHANYGYASISKYKLTEYLMTTQNVHHNLFQMSRLKSNRDRATAEYDSFAFLKEHVCSELVERVRDVTRRFSLALDWGSHDGRGACKLVKSQNVEHAVCVETSPLFAMASRTRSLPAVSAPFECIPFLPNSFDLFVSTLSLHWVNELPKFFIEVNKSLVPDGLFVAAMFGVGTLKELRESLIEAEIEVSGGAQSRLPPMPSLHDMATLLQQTGFALPVADIEPITVRYDDLFQLLKDIRGMGEQVPIFPKRDSIASRRLLNRTNEVYRRNYAQADGKIPATFQIIWLSGWTPSPDQPKALRPGSAKHSLADAIRHPEKLD